MEAPSDPATGADAAAQRAAPRGARRRWAAGWLAAGLASVLAGLLLSLFVAGVVVVHGHSMEPTLHNGEHVLVLRSGAWLHRLGLGRFAPGDIVFFPDPSRPMSPAGRWLDPHLLIKRIVADGSSTVGMRAGVVRVDGRPLRERYLAGDFRGLGSVPATRVPPGDVYVMGDNRRPTASFDSRSFGPVPAASIEGRAVMVVWPLLRRTPSGWRWNVRLLTPPRTPAPRAAPQRARTAARP